LRQTRKTKRLRANPKQVPKPFPKEFLTAKNANHAKAFVGKARQAAAHGPWEPRIKPVAKKNTKSEDRPAATQHLI
jgi:hypothetical protein